MNICLICKFKDTCTNIVYVGIIVNCKKYQQDYDLYKEYVNKKGKKDGTKVHSRETPTTST